MVQITGKYQHVANENFEEFVQKMGNQELAAAFLVSRPLVEIQQTGDQWTIIVSVEGKSSSATFKLNERYEERLPLSDRRFQSVATKEGNKIKIETEVADGAKLYRLYEFTDTEMKVHLSSTKFDSTASRVYKRV